MPSARPAHEKSLEASASTGSAALGSLNAIARQVGCAIFVVIHLNKGASSDPLLRHEGSAAFTQIIRGAMLLGRP